MRDLSLHILDLMENSIRAQATVISVTLAEDPVKNTLEITVEDNGPGLSVPAQMATHPFYTTKDGKRVGLGLSLFRAAVERAQGEVTLNTSPLGGLAVKATMQLHHIDRSPMGDLASTFSSIVCTNPSLDLWCRFCVGNRECVVRVSDIMKELPANERWGLAVARRVCEKVKAGLAEIGVTE